MADKRAKVRFNIIVAVAAGLFLCIAMMLGLGGMQRLAALSGMATIRHEADLGTLMLVAGLRDQVRSQERAGREAISGPSASEDFERQNALIQTATAQLGARFGTQEARRVGEAHRDWVIALRSGDAAAAAGFENSLLGRLSQLSSVALDEHRAAAAAAAEARRATQFAATGMVCLTAAVGIALALVAGFRLLRAQQRALGAAPAELAAVAGALARGELNAADKLDPGKGGDIASALRSIALGMQQLVAEVHGNSIALSQAADTLVTGTAQIAAGSADQAAAAAGMAASVGQLSANIGQVTEHSHMALRISRESGELSEEASGVVSCASGELEGVAQSARELTGIIQALGLSSGRISSIVSVIQDIANQTNLLALNAAIEAARAGEQGRGFSVVADEVRKLADRTTESTREISGMIQSIQNGTAQAVVHMEKWGVSVTGGVAKAQGAGARMEKIRTGALEVMQAVGLVSGALAEQSTASNEIAAAVVRIAAMSEQGRASVGAMDASAQAVARLASSLGVLAARFQAAPSAA